MFRITEDLLQTFRDNFRSFFSRIERSSSGHRRFVTDVSGQFSVPFFKDRAFFFGSQKICHRRFGTIFGPFFQGLSVLLRITEDLLQTFRDNFRSLFSRIERSSSDHRRFATDVSGQFSVPFFKCRAFFLGCLTLEDGKKKFFRNVCNKLSFYAAQNTRTTQNSFTWRPKPTITLVYPGVVQIHHVQKRLTAFCIRHL